MSFAGGVCQAAAANEFGVVMLFPEHWLSEKVSQPGSPQDPGPPLGESATHVPSGQSVYFGRQVTLQPPATHCAEAMP